MKICKTACCRFCTKWANPSLGLLFMRVAVGVVFMAHGLQKWQMMDQVIAFFSSIGLPAFMAYVVTAIEVLAGLALVLGIGTCLAGLLLSAVMIGAILKVKWGFSLIPTPTSPGSYEIDVLLLFVSFGIALIGPGRYSLGARLKGACGDANCVNCSNK